jgi:hypothetical protein
MIKLLYYEIFNLVSKAYEPFGLKTGKTYNKLTESKNPVESLFDRLLAFEIAQHPCLIV